MKSNETESLIEHKLTPKDTSFRTHTLPLTILFLIMYSVGDLSLPLFNKVLDNGFGSEKGFHYPVTSAMVQVGLVAICLLIWCIIERSWKIRTGNVDEEWIFSDLKGFLLKIRELLVVSFLFAGIITLSNIGLDKVSLNVHVLLRTTSFVWVILFSLFLKGERPTLLQLLFASFVISGAVLLSIDAGKDWSVGDNAASGIIINLASSFCSGLATVLLRNVCLRTETQPHLRMSIVEITMIKMGLATLFMLIPALVLDTFLKINTNDTVWQALREQWLMGIMVMVGALLTLVYQSSIVAVTANVGAVTVGILHQILTLPQLALYTILIVTHALPESWKIKMLQATPFHISGATLILVGTLLYACLRIYKVKYGKKAEQPSMQVDEEDVVGSLNQETISQPWYQRFKDNVRDWRS